MSLLPWVLYPLLAIVLVELLLAWRNVGVGRRQWYRRRRSAAIVAALLVAALFDPVLRRPAERVATVFVIDGSASVGAAGTNAAEQFVADALAERPDSALAGVVVFGADARVDQVMGDASSFGGPTAVIDRGATDVAGGLRLGAAMLPNDARRRIVLVSDGRATSGDVSDEIEELEAAGIPVDVVTLETTGGPDAAVAGIDLPDLARPDDVVPVIVHVQASEATEATVVLRRDGEEVGRQTVELVPGDNEVRFEDTPGADAGAVMRYQATVTASAQHRGRERRRLRRRRRRGPGPRARRRRHTGRSRDAGRGAQRGRGRHRGDRRRQHPRRAGARHATPASCIVDVDARTLTGDQIDNITTAVRDLGRGLVTIGGERSYGVGGYLESPLNDLLPVDSEIVDPMRRRTVAEVLSIDTSESMGACHCAGEADGQRAGRGRHQQDRHQPRRRRAHDRGARRERRGRRAGVELERRVGHRAADAAAGRRDRPRACGRCSPPATPTSATRSPTPPRRCSRATPSSSTSSCSPTGSPRRAAIEDTAEEAGRLYEEHGITVSVLATGESPEQAALEDIATAGHGRFYAGTDFDERARRSWPRKR